MIHPNVSSAGSRLELERCLRRHREEYGIARRANAILLCQRFFGVTTLEDLTEACLNAWENVPQHFFQNIFFRSHFFKLGHPDLFIWNENEFQYVEVKSPNDVLQTRARGHSGFPLGLISDSNFQNGGLNERATVCIGMLLSK